jgi:hypothetical protein
MNLSNTFNSLPPFFCLLPNISLHSLSALSQSPIYPKNPLTEFKIIIPGKTLILQVLLNVLLKTEPN